MSEEYCDGVKILLKRMESNPEEFKDTDKWEQFTSPQNLRDGFWSHALSPEEIEALRGGMRKIYRDVFTKRVMATLLEGKEEEAGLSANSFANALQNAYNPYQNAYPYPRPSAFAQSQPPSSSEILARAKKVLGLK